MTEMSENTEKPVTLLERRLAYQGKILKVYDDYVDVGGHRTHWDFIHHMGAAAVLPVTEDGKIMLVRQYRHALSRFTLELPAGKIDRGEKDPEAAMKRELKEETGYTADQIRYLGCINPSVAYSEEVIHLYLMTGLTPGEQKLDEDEALEVELMPFDEVCRMAETGQLSDAKTVAGVLMAKAQR